MRLFDGYANYEDALSALRLFSKFHEAPDTSLVDFRYETDDPSLRRLLGTFEYPRRIVKEEEMSSVR